MLIIAKKGMLILGKILTDRLADTTTTAEAEYSINFSEQKNKSYVSLHYKGSSSYLFVNREYIYQFQAKVAEIKLYEFCLGNILKDFTVNNMKETGFYGYF